MPSRVDVGVILDTLWDVADRARSRAPFSRDDKNFVSDTLPAALAGIERVSLPKSFRHPAGFAVSGAPVATFAHSALILAGQKALGKRFDGHPFFEEVEKSLAFRIMRSSFHHDYPKGTHCCVQCTLAVYPVLKAGAIRYFECAPLVENVRDVIRNREWRFAGAVNASMMRWSLGEDYASI